jgi:class 3 adenylate cyclase/CHASE2 domain-containing sensor protein
MNIGRRDLIAVLAAAFAISLVVASAPFDRLRGIGIDVLTLLHWSILGPRHEVTSSPAVIVALDEVTFNSPPFNRTPTVTWTREIAKVLTAIVDAGASVVGFDVIFPTSIEQSQISLGNETLGDRVRGFDREFLQALARIAQTGKIVLGQVQHQELPIRPSEGQRVAVGHQANIRPLNFYTDPDDVVRRMPVFFTVDGKSMPSMAVELSARALRVEPTRTRDGGFALGATKIPVSKSNTFTISFNGEDDAPIYSLADLSACVERGNADYFSKHFSGRVVLIGAVLDVEDRKVASNRYAAGTEGARAERCALAPPRTSGRFVRDSVAGVRIHAAAINNLLRGDALTELARANAFAVTFLVTVLLSAPALFFRPAVAAGMLVAGLFVWTAIALTAFAGGLVLPLVDAASATLGGFLAAIGYRIGVVDRDKILLRKSFALYLPPSEVDKMLATNRPPELGGETREVTAYFSDLAGFSSLAEGMRPSDLVRLMNEYLSAMTDIIEAHGGYVDKFIGDAIVAIFGAPVPEAKHALHAVRAAIASQRKLDDMNRSLPRGGKLLRQRIGINSGSALIGNIGSKRRFNYTAMGDTVNLAARLEGANKHYGTVIIASEETVSLAGDAVRWRELDTVRVAGIARSVRIHEPLTIDERSADEVLTVYARGLRCWREHDFEGARAAFSGIADRDPPAARFLDRIKRLDKPGLGWTSVTDLDK